MIFFQPPSFPLPLFTILASLGTRFHSGLYPGLSPGSKELPLLHQAKESNHRYYPQFLLTSITFV